MEILCAYVRQNFPAVNLNPQPELQMRPEPRADLQAVISLLGRRAKDRIAIEDVNQHRLDLRNCDLSGCDFSGSDFTAARFNQSKFDAAIFGDGCFRAALFHDALISYGHVAWAQFEGTNFSRAKFFRKWPGWSFGLRLTEERTAGVILSGTTFTECSLYGKPEALSLSFGDASTVVGRDLEPKLEALDLDKADLAKENDDPVTEHQEALSAVKASGFEHWSRYSSDDLMTGQHLNQFRRKMGHDRFPYSEG